ncbi:MAG: hypothetical protein CMK32_16520 [Porticoccaceae bacterium]|nr:hypothetical protein [Porticoccaceae bacterium]
MTAEIILLKHPEVRFQNTPNVIVCGAVPSDSKERNMGRLGFQYFPDLGEFGIFATRPAGWSEDDIRTAYRNFSQ